LCVGGADGRREASNERGSRASSGKEIYRLACEQDLEGIVAKLKHGAYGEGWFKIRNRANWRDAK
jgi:ATP-dependent DNA ligase